LGLEDELKPDLGILLLLGYVSAVEGYMRGLLRELINVDPLSKQMCEKLQLTYAAAMHHEEEALADALLEETVFASSAAIPAALEKFLGIRKLSLGTRGLIEQYGQICQLRHCCVHRFGKLGTKNAVELGMQAHSAFLEKSVIVTKTRIAEIADLMFALIKSVNNEVFGLILGRTVVADAAPSWTWNKAKDRARFQLYYRVFASSSDPIPSPSASDVYSRFRRAHQTVRARRIPPPLV
jgi:hypothetical protein